jgi:hypothetical protein
MFQISLGGNRDIFIKTTLINNFLTVQPILTNNIPIMSAQHVDENVSLKICKFHSRGAIREFSENVIPLITFKPFNRFLLAACRSIRSDKWKTIKHRICFIFQFKGATRKFSSKNTPNNNFSTVRPIPTNSIPIEWIHKIKTKPSKISKFQSMEATVESTKTNWP